MPSIWIINQAAIAPTQGGGTRHFSLARVLIQHGFRPTIINEAGDGPVGAHTVDGVDFFSLPARTNKANKFRRLGSMLHFMRALLRPLPLAIPDLIYGSSPPLFAAWGAWLLAKRHQVPFILEIRDIWPDSLVDIAKIPHWHPMILLLRRIERGLYRRTDHIVTLLPESAAYFMQHGVPATHITVLPNGIDPTLHAAPPTPAPHTGFHLYYTGALGIPNGLEQIMEAADLLQQQQADICFHLVGHGVLKPKLEAMVQKRGLQNILFHPPVPKQHMAELLCAADAFLLVVPDRALYRWGTSPNKLYDYLFAARPVLYASTIIPATMVQSNCVFSALPTAEGIARAALALAAMRPEEREAMGERARDYVLAHHDMRELGNRLAVILSSVRRRNG